MKKNFFVFKILLYTFIFLGIFNSSYGKILEFNQDAKNISNYFSGLISFNDSDYVVSEKFLRKLSNFEDGNKNYPRKYIQSLINLQKFNEVEKYSKKLEKKNQSNFESNLFLGLYEFKEKNYDKALIYFKKLKSNYEHRYVFEILDITLNGWIEISKSKNLKSIDFLNFKNTAFNNIEIIQKTFAHCYIDSKNTEREFMSLLNNKNFNFSRYDFFISNYYFNKKDNEKALKLINLSKEKYPTNLLIAQFKNTLIGKEKNLNNFNCKNAEDVLAETFYIIANALSSSENYRLSNFYVNLSKFLNPDFLSYNILLAENLLALKKYENAKKTYKNLFKVGTFYKWYSAKRIAMIMEEKKETNSINFLSNIYSSIDPGDYQIYDYANFLRNKEKYKDSIKLYSEILKKINKDHELYPEILERRGMAYERSDNWDLAEKDLLKSLEIKPKDAYVMNYLAYSWIEKNKNIDKSLKMLKEANDIERNSGYITDSLGWALFKSKKFLESKKYLEIAIMLMPKDPVISDHYADCLWMNDFKIQARYDWNSVLKSDDADIELKNKVKDKILFGLKNI